MQFKKQLKLTKIIKTAKHMGLTMDSNMDFCEVLSAW
jgi:hypothetical protein